MDESNLQEFIVHQRIEAKVIALPSRVHTVREAAEAASIDERAIIKSLVFLTDEGKLVMAILRGDTKLSERKLASVLGVKGVAKAKPGRILEETGYPVGGVPPVGHKKPITTVMDDAVLGEEVVYGGGGTETCLLQIRTQDIVRIQNAKIADIRE